MAAPYPPLQDDSQDEDFTPPRPSQVRPKPHSRRATAHYISAVPHQYPSNDYPFPDQTDTDNDSDTPPHSSEDEEYFLNPRQPPIRCPSCHKPGDYNTRTCPRCTQHRRNEAIARARREKRTMRILYDRGLATKKRIKGKQPPPRPTWIWYKQKWIPN